MKNIQFITVQFHQYTKVTQIAKKFYDDQNLYFIVYLCNPNIINALDIYVPQNTMIKLPKHKKDLPKLTNYVL